MRKLCFVTGTRAEYGLLRVLMKKILTDREFQMQIIATGMHLSPEFGLTYQEIEEDGFHIDYKVEMLLSSDTPVGIAKSMGLGVIGFADAYRQLKPDLIILLGDRFEILAAAQTALVAKIPAAHIGGGDVTEGAFDEAIRHSITKMSHLHFVTNEQSGRRVRQLGENPDHIFNAGSLAIDRIANLKPSDRKELERRVGFSFHPRNLLITFHPVTLDEDSSAIQFTELLEALDRIGPETGLIFTKPNADPGGREIINLLENFASTHRNSTVFTSLGDQGYLSLLSQVDAVVGNSSSGIYEAPSFQKPTVNIGDRQTGRIFASSVICCVPEREAIEKAIREAFHKDCSDTVNPYGSGNSVEKIWKILREIPDYQILLKKKFYSIP